MPSQQTESLQEEELLFLLNKIQIALKKEQFYIGAYGDDVCHSQTVGASTQHRQWQGNQLARMNNRLELRVELFNNGSEIGINLI